MRTSDEDMDESEKEQEGEEEEEEEEEAEEEEEEEEEEEVVEQEAKEEEDDEVVPVDLNIGEFKGPLQFYAWKELLATVHPGERTWSCLYASGSGAGRSSRGMSSLAGKAG